MNYLAGNEVKVFPDYLKIKSKIFDRRLSSFTVYIQSDSGIK